MLGTLLSLTLIAAQAPGNDTRDRVELLRGSVVSGRVLLQLEDKIAIQVGTREQWIERSRIKTISSIAERQREIFADLRKVRNNSTADLNALARRAADEGLLHEARIFSWHVLALEPDNPEANAALGHRQSRGEWLLPIDKSQGKFESLTERRSDWATAWTLRSEHFALRSNASLQNCLNTLYELEYFYLAFFAIFQDRLQLRELIEPIKVSVYGDQTEIPALSDNVGAWFSTDEEILYTWMMASGRPFALFHEGTHALLYHLTAGSTRGRGGLPGWLDEAWAEFMSAGMVSEVPGRAGWNPSRVNASHYRRLSKEKKPYGLHRLLNFKSSDFAASTKQPLKYAQSYALFNFLIRAGEPDYRPAFYEYLAMALTGRGQASSFRRLFARDLRSIEAKYLLPR